MEIRKKTRILWISSHPPIKKHLEELKRIFGDYEIIHYSGRIKGEDRAAQVVRLMKIYNADEVVPLIPITMILRLVNKYKIFPILPESERLPRGSKEYDYIDERSGEKYRFKGFVRITRFEIEKKPL